MTNYYYQTDVLLPSLDSLCSYCTQIIAMVCSRSCGHSSPKDAVVVKSKALPQPTVVLELDGSRDGSSRAGRSVLERDNTSLRSAIGTSGSRTG